MVKRHGMSYEKRLADINRIYDEYAKTGLSNREIWRRYIYPRYGISESTLYNMLKASGTHRSPEELQKAGFEFYDSKDDGERGAGYFKKHTPGY